MRGKIPYFYFISLKFQGKDFKFLAVDLLDFNVQFINFFTFYRSLDIEILSLNFNVTQNPWRKY